MLKRLTLSAAMVLSLTSGAIAAGGGGKTHDFNFSFEGPFGTFDEHQLQRGLQIYTEVCSACHGLKYVPIRTLGDEGGPHYSEDQVRAYAGSNFEVFDPSLDDGAGDYRAATPNDAFPGSNDENAPDLSLMAKARAGFSGPAGTGLSQLINGMGGAEYIATLLTSYHDAPACAPEDFPGYYNTYFASGGYPDECKDENNEHTVGGSWISMAPPLYDEQIEFADGHEATVESMSKDAAAFLMWTAEPKMMARQRAGFIGVLILSIFSVLLYLTNKRLWAPVKRAAKAPAE